MHLKSHPKFVCSELHLDAISVQMLSQQSPLFGSQQGAPRRTSSGNHGNIGSSRHPLGVISTNTLHRGNATSNSGSSVVSLRLKAAPVPALRLLPPPSGYENDALRLYQVTPEDVDAPPDIWTVIKPGHVREKIAIFASDRVRDGECASASVPAARERTTAVCTNNASAPPPLRAGKAKGSWEESSSAKRRRRSGTNQNLQQDQRTQVLDSQRHAHKLSPRHLDSAQLSGGGPCAGHAWTAGEEEEQKVSVVEMVAFLEQRVGECQTESKPVLKRSSATIMLSRAPPTKVRGEEPEFVKVSDMVAKLESECLRRKSEGTLSRSSSLRRTVGRVLLAAGYQVSTPSQPSSPSSTPMTPSSPSTQTESQSAGREPTSCSEMPTTKATAPPLTPPPSYLIKPPSPPSGEADGEPQEAKGGECLGTQTPSHAQTATPVSEGVEPPPGLLFLPHPSSDTDSAPPLMDSEPRPPCRKLTFDSDLVLSNSGCHSEKKRRRREADRAPEGDAGVPSPPSFLTPVGRRVSASQDFLEMRQRLRQLLEPQPYLAMLPHHLLVKILLLLPTQSLAALKCTSQYFRFIIDTYGVRPADSLWVSDPRYRDDPCKQCKKRYGRGDVSLCRWHHKPFCQALPYGPGFWMCCHGAHRDAPGCNVGLHDNRWVPAFHSINVPIYRRNHHD